MKKIVAVLLCAVLLLNCGVAMAAQTSTIQEDKAINVIIDGTPLKLSNVAVIKDKKLMLSAEILTGLGISKGNQVWDKSKTKLTLTKGKTKLLIQVNSSAAVLNGVKKTLSVKPFIYKSKAYFPVDFLADCFGEVMNKDSETDTYFIKDKASYNINKSLLDSVLKSMNSISKLKEKEFADLSLSGNNVNINLTAPVTTSMDIVSKKAVGSIDYKMNTNGTVSENKIQLAMADNKQYAKVDQGTWTQQDLSPEEFADDFSFNSMLKYDSAVLSGLNLTKGAKADEKVLKGNVMIGSTLPNFLKSQNIDKNTVSAKYVEITINKNYVSKIVLREAGITDIKGLKFNFSVNYQMEFSDINGTFDVVLPDDLKQ